MAEVVSVSEPSPLDVFNTGLRELVLSEDEGWSGTGIVSAVYGKTKKRLRYQKPGTYQKSQAHKNNATNVRNKTVERASVL